MTPRRVLADPLRREGASVAARRARERERAAIVPSVLERGLVAALAAAIPLYLALRGGAYDIVVRQEAGLVLWWGLAVAFLAGVLPRARPARAARLPLLAVALLVGWGALSLLWTSSAEQTFAELARTLDYAGIVVLAYAAVHGGTWRWAAGGLSAGILALPVVSIASRLDPSAFPADVAAQAFPGGRLGWPLGYWNAIGCWADMAIAAGLAWSVHARRASLRELSLAAVPFAGAAAYLSYSRTAVAGSALAVILAVALSRNRASALLHALVAGLGTGLLILVIRGQPAIADAHGSAGAGWVALALVLAALACAAAARWTARRPAGPSRALREARLALALAAAAAIAAGVLLGPPAASRSSLAASSRSGPPIASADPSARLVSLSSPRYEIWSSALRAFESRPLTGIGPGTFQFWWPRDSRSGQQLLDAHSLPLETLAELGLPGLAFLLAFLGGLAALALRARRRLAKPPDIAAAAALVAAFAVYLLHASVDWMWEVPAVSATAIGAIAIAGAATGERRHRRRRLSGGLVAAVCLAILAGAVQVPGIVSADRLRAAEQDALLGFDREALDLADQAVRAEPWAASPYAARAFAELRARRPAAALADAREAVSRERESWRLRLLLAHAEAAAQNDAAARRAIGSAVRLGAPRAVASSAGKALRGASR